MRKLVFLLLHRSIPYPSFSIHCALTRALKIMSEVIVHYPFMTCRQSLELPKLPNDVCRARRVH